MSQGLYSGVSGLAIGVGLYKGTSSLWSGAAGLITPPGGATLSLGFLNTSTLPSTITFSRGSNATLTDSTGRVTYAPNNQTPNSEDFDASGWTKVRATVGANAAAAPNGTTTADKFIEDTTASSSHVIGRSISTTASVTYTYSVYAKAAERSFIAFAFPATAFTPSQVIFDLSTQTATTTSGSLVASGVQTIGNGWYRCYATITATTTASAFLEFRLAINSTSGGVTYTGDGTSGLYIWGAQYEAVTYQTTPGTYNSTTPANLLGFTQEFDNAAWSKTNSTVTADATTAPDGTTSADKLLDNATSGSHAVYQNATITANTPYTASAYVKAGERTRIKFYWALGSNVSGGNVDFDLSTGTQIGSVTVYGTGSGYSAKIENAGSGWYRVSITGVVDASSTSGRITIAMLNPGTSYVGDGGGVYVWGAQLSNSASLTPYVYNPAAALTTTAYYGPRFDYDPVTLVSKGLLIEEQRTNLLLQSQTFDNASWAKTDTTITANVATSPNGTTDADKLIATAVSTNAHQVSQAINFVAGTTYSMTCYMRAGEYAFGNLLLPSAAFTSNQIGTFDLVNGLASVSLGTPTVSISNAGNGWWRVSVVATATTTAAGSAVIRVNSTYSNNVYTGDGTSGIYIWGAQIEAGAFATSYIPTVAATVTRSADIATMSGTNFSSWYNQSEGTLLSQSSNFSKASFPVVVALNDATLSNRINHISSTTTANRVSVATGGFTQAEFAFTNYVSGSIVTEALAIKSNDFAGCVNADTVQTDASGTLPTVSQLQLGAQAGGLSPLNGHIRAIAYYPQRLPNATLQALTA